jgi:hypothetical protein
VGRIRHRLGCKVASACAQHSLLCRCYPFLQPMVVLVTSCHTRRHGMSS